MSISFMICVLRNSWCLNQRALAQGETPHSHSVKPPCLSNMPSDKQEDIKRIYTDLTKTELLERWLKGISLNLNESIHDKLWAKRSKTEHRGPHQSKICSCCDNYWEQFFWFLEHQPFHSSWVWCLSTHCYRTTDSSQKDKHHQRRQLRGHK